MAKKELTLIIRAKAAVAAAFKTVTGGLASIGGAALNVGKWIGAGMAAATVAVGAFAAKALSAWAVQEKATRSLSMALQAQGEDAAKLVPELQKVAGAIQDETGAADESTLAGMAKMRMLGVQTSKLGEAARAVIALKGVGLEEAAAQKAVAMAMQGSYDMLNRYVPALRVAKTETEKAAIVNDLFTKGYAQQAGLLNTTSGAWAAFKGRIGDVWEEFGKAIDRAGGIRDALTKAGDAVKAFGQRVAEWIESKEFEALQTSIQNILQAITSGGGQRAEALDILWDGLKAALGYGADMLKAAGDYIALKIQAAVKRALGGKFAAKDAAIIEGEAGKMWSIGKDQARLNFLLKRYQLEKRIAALAPEGFVGPPAPPPAAAPAVIADAEEQDAIVENHEDANRKIEELERERAAVVKAELQKSWQDQKNAAEKELALAEELAGKKIAAFIAEKKEQAALEKQANRDKAGEAKRAATYEDRLRRGGRLSKTQQEWLNAFNAIKNAGANIGPLRDQIKVAEDNLAQLQQTNRTLAAIDAELAQHNAKLNQLLAMG